MCRQNVLQNKLILLCLHPKSLNQVCQLKKENQYAEKQSKPYHPVAWTLILSVIVVFEGYLSSPNLVSLTLKRLRIQKKKQNLQKTFYDASWK